MAQTSQEIHNPRTGQRMVFLETGADNGGELLRIDSFNPPAKGEPEPEHVHPHQESGAKVISGSLRFRVDGQERSLGPGQTITIPPNTRHNFWNDGDEDAHSIQWFRPALDIAAFFETFFALAQAGQLNAKGMPGLLQLAAMSNFGNEVRVTKPPWPVQRAVLSALAPIVRWRGYHARHELP